MMIYRKGEPTNIYDVKALLYVQEAQLDKYMQELPSRSAITNIAQGLLSIEATKMAHRMLMAITIFLGRGRSTRGKGYGRQTHTTQNRPTYQLCNKYGNFVLECQHMFDENFESAHHKAQYHGSVSNNSTGSQSSEAQESSAPQATTYLTHHNTLAIPQDLESQAQFPDSVASHHITTSIMKVL